MRNYWLRARAERQLAELVVAFQRAAEAVLRLDEMAR